MLAVTEANRAGYDEAILLTAEGFVADGSGENVFIVKEGVIYTPDLSTSILPGITRDTVIQIAQDLGYRVVEKSLIRSDLYLADEAFMCGTAAEVTPLREADAVQLGAGAVPLARPWMGEREEELVLEVLRSGRLSLGPTIDRFEELVAERVGAPYAAAVSSGTAGLHLLCHIAGLGPGDEAITSPVSFVASA